MVSLNVYFSDKRITPFPTNSGKTINLLGHIVKIFHNSLDFKAVKSHSVYFDIVFIDSRKSFKTVKVSRHDLTYIRAYSS